MDEMKSSDPSTEPAGEPIAPPERPAPTRDDRSALERRVKDLARQRETSLAAVERRMGRARGTLSKVFGGRIRLSHSILVEVCTVLEVEPVELVDGTAFRGLLDEAVPTADSAALVAARMEVDRLSRDLAARDAQVDEWRREVDRLRRELESKVAAATAAQAEAEKRGRENSELRDRVTSAQAALLEADRARSDAVTKANGEMLKMRLEGGRLRGELGAAIAQLQKWTQFGNERAAKVQQLEAYIQNKSSVGPAVLGGLLGFMLGSSGSAPSRRRTRG